MSGACLDTRRKVLRDLQRARAAAVAAGDGFLRDVLDGMARQLKACVAYAENRFYGGSTTAVLRRSVNRLPPPENPRDNRAVTGLENGK